MAANGRRRPGGSRLPGLLLVLTVGCTAACATPGSVAVGAAGQAQAQTQTQAQAQAQAQAQTQAQVAPAPAAQELPEPAGGLPQPPTGSRPWTTGRAATAAEARTYARAVQALGRAPFRVVQRDVLAPRVEVRDEDPAAGLVRTSVVQDDGRILVTELDVAGRPLRTVGLPDQAEVALPGDRWLAQDHHALPGSPTLSTLDPTVDCPGSCPLQVVGPGTFLLLPPPGDDGLGSRSEVVLAAGRVVSWHTWYPEDVANAAEAAEYASVLVDLPPDAGLRPPDPASVVSVAEQARRAAERQRRAQEPVRTCGPVVNGIQACAEVRSVPLDPTAVGVPDPDGVLEAPPVPTPTG